MKLYILCALGLVLVSCDSVKDTFGLAHNQADEFSVSDNPPLTIPKDFRLKKPSTQTDTKCAPNGKNNPDPAKEAVKALKKK